MLSQNQKDAAKVISSARPGFGWKENAKTIVLTSPDGTDRYVVRPNVVQRQSKHSKELGGGWFTVRSVSTKDTAARWRQY